MQIAIDFVAFGDNFCLILSLFASGTEAKKVEWLVQGDNVKECIKNQKIILDFWSSKEDTLFTFPSSSIEETHLNG